MKRAIKATARTPGPRGSGFIELDWEAREQRSKKARQSAKYSMIARRRRQKLTEASILKAWDQLNKPPPHCKAVPERNRAAIIASRVGCSKGHARDILQTHGLLKTRT